MQKIIFLVIVIILSSCKQEEQVPDPAQKQIDEYTKDLESCDKEPKKEQEVEKKSIGFSVAPSDIVLGNLESKVVVVEYFAPTCPHCANYHKAIFPEIKAKYIDTKKIAYVMREFIGTKQDLDASILARCKGDIDSYIKFMDVILSKQDSWVTNKNYRELLTNIGNLGGISPESFAKCLNDQEKVKILMENTKFAAALPKFGGTPSFFINGESFNGRYTAEELSVVIDKYLNTSKN